MFYDNLIAACAERGTTVTQTLRAIGRAEGSTGKWKAGSTPNLSVVMELAQYLHVSIDELAFGPDAAPQYNGLTDSDKEWLSIAHCIPDDRQQMCKDFLRTHMVQPEKYLDKKSG